LVAITHGYLTLSRVMCRSRRLVVGAGLDFQSGAVAIRAVDIACVPVGTDADGVVAVVGRTPLVREKA
jgi:hypothetical protein